MLELKTMSATAVPGPICVAPERDGARVVEGKFRYYLAGLGSHSDRITAAMGSDARAPRHPNREEFYGTKTIRVDGISARLKTSVQPMFDLLMHEVCEQVRRPNCDNYIFDATQVVPSSHRWDPERELDSHEIGYAVMKAGLPMALLS